MKKEFTPTQNLVENYIRTRRGELLNPVAYQFGYNSIESIVFGLWELVSLAGAFQLYELANETREKATKLSPYLTKRAGFSLVL